jgi:hypothetical protein
MLGKTRDQIKTILGEPDDTGGTSRKYKSPMVYKYADIEYWFTPYKDGICFEIVKRIDADTHLVIDKIKKENS